MPKYNINNQNVVFEDVSDKLEILGPIGIFKDIAENLRIISDGMRKLADIYKIISTREQL